VCLKIYIFSTNPEDDVAKVLAELETNKSHGPDNIPPIILKLCAKELAPSRAKLFNISLSSGNLPSEWKVANVVPMHKSGDRALATNYRPVSLTSIVVRSLERLICLVCSLKNCFCSCLFELTQSTSTAVSNSYFLKAVFYAKSCLQHI